MTQAQPQPVRSASAVSPEPRVIGHDRDTRARVRSIGRPSGPLRVAYEGVSAESIAPLRYAAALGIALVAAAAMVGLWIATPALHPTEAWIGSPSASNTGLVGRMLLIDERLFVFLNALGSDRWDGLWLFVTHKHSWIPLYLAFLYLVYRNFGLKRMLIVFAWVVVMITITDQLSNLFKVGFERLRPCREEHLRELIRYVAPSCGRYGYFSAHAANSMAFAAFASLLFGRIYRFLTPAVLVWAAAVAYSRIYVGVHYPLDMLTGMIIGGLVGSAIHVLSCRLKPSATR